MHLIIAITGGIGSGKTTVSNIISSKYKMKYINVDQISKEILQNIYVQSTLKKYFGSTIFTNSFLDKNKLKKIIFSNKQKRLWLNQFLHSIIRYEISKQIQYLKQNIILEIPLLNADYKIYYPYINQVITVITSKSKRVERIKRKDNLARREIQSIMDAQINDNDRIKFSDYLIYNNESQIHLLKQIKKIYSNIIENSTF